MHFELWLYPYRHSSHGATSCGCAVRVTNHHVHACVLRHAGYEWQLADVSHSHTCAHCATPGNSLLHLAVIKAKALLAAGLPDIFLDKAWEGRHLAHYNAQGHVPWHVDHCCFRRDLMLCYHSSDCCIAVVMKVFVLDACFCSPAQNGSYRRSFVIGGITSS